MIPDRKVWSPDEDNILKEILSHRKQQKWSGIAKIMEKTYNINGRTGKQCRERWHNQLDPDIKTDVWGEDQEDKLFQYHNQFGNKWAKIAQRLPGRTDNCIKNHFYCTLRKSLRKVNKFIALERNKGRFKEIKNIIMSKIIAVAQQKFERRLDVPERLIDVCCEIKNSLVKYSKDIDTEDQKYHDDLCQLVIKITDFNKAYKRKKNLKKGSKQQTNKSQQEESNEELEEEEKDKVSIDVQERFKMAEKGNVVDNQKETAPVEPPKAKANPGFVKKPSFTACLLSQSMEMQLEDKLHFRPQITGVFPNFQSSSPVRTDGASTYIDHLFKQFEASSPKSLTPINPMFQQLRKIESFDFENFRKKH